MKIIDLAFVVAVIVMAGVFVMHGGCQIKVTVHSEANQ